MESMGSFFGIVAIGAGIYCIYGYLLMIRRREIPKGIMLPRDTDPKKCRDVDAYIRMTSLPLICVAVLLLFVRRAGDGQPVCGPGGTGALCGAASLRGGAHLARRADEKGERHLLLENILTIYRQKNAGFHFKSCIFSFFKVENKFADREK